MKNTRDSLPEALKRQRRMLSMNGTLDFSKLQITDLKHLGSQKALQTLILDGTPISSLHTLPPQPSLKKISAKNTKLSTLAGLTSQNKLSSVSFEGTPISKVENFRLAVMLAVGPRINSINGRTVTQTERRMAKAFPPVAKYLVNAGWVVSYPPPSDLDFHYLAEQFEIQAANEDFISPVPPISVPAATKQQENDDTFVYDEDAPFTEQLASILRPLGFAIRIGPEVHDDIIRAVSTICDTVEKVEQMSKM